MPADFLEAYSSVFAAMEQHELVLNLHGEWPGPSPSDGLSLEEAFLPELKKLHEKFPRLRCVLEVTKSLPLTTQNVVTRIALLHRGRSTCRPGLWPICCWFVRSSLSCSFSKHTACRNDNGTSPLLDRRR